MSKALTIWLIILIIAAVGVDVLILKPTSSCPSTMQVFTTSDLWRIVVSGNSDLVDVTTTSEDYYRVRTGGIYSEGKYINQNFFQDQTKLPVGEWDLEDADSRVSFTVVSEYPITIHRYAALGAFLITILLTIMVMLLLFTIGLQFEQ